MQYITEELYKKMQMFQLPMDDDVSLGDLEEWGLDLDDFFRQELLARDEWYLKYTPERLKELLFNASGEVIFAGLTEEIIQLVRAFREQVEEEWAEAMAWIDASKAQASLTASEDMQHFLTIDFQDGEIRYVDGIDTDEVNMEVLVGWDSSELVMLTFKGVRESWMGRMHPDDANWWLYDELSVNEQGRYVLHVLFGNADYVGQLQLVFEDIEVSRVKLD